MSAKRAIADQFAGRVGLFPRVDAVDATYGGTREASVEFLVALRRKPYGPAAIVVDAAGNRWYLLGRRRSH